jgi:hypothetical protein
MSWWGPGRPGGGVRCPGGCEKSWQLRGYVLAGESGVLVGGEVSWRGGGNVLVTETGVLAGWKTSWAARAAHGRPEGTRTFVLDNAPGSLSNAPIMRVTQPQPSQHRSVVTRRPSNRPNSAVRQLRLNYTVGPAQKPPALARSAQRRWTISRRQLHSMLRTRTMVRYPRRSRHKPTATPLRRGRPQHSRTLSRRAPRSQLERGRPCNRPSSGSLPSFSYFSPPSRASRLRHERRAHVLG